MPSSFVRKYKFELLKCYNYNFNTRYDISHDFSTEELFQLKDNHIYRFMAHKVYGKPDPDESDRPTEGRSASIEFAKKAISYFMPNKLMKWDMATNTGNPTKSVVVNELIKRVKKQEVRKQGKPSRAVRAMELSEFNAFIRGCRETDSGHIGHRVGVAYFLFQFHMIARLDDVMNFKIGDLMSNIEFPDTIKSKMRWSKNVLEERESPDQIIFGSMDWTYCVLVSLAIHLEHATLERDEDGSIPMFGVKKERMRDLFTEITNQESFQLVLPGPIGTHSIRKMPATYARRNGCSKDDVDARGRWKSNKRMVDTYIDCVIPYPDAKVAATLSIGGPVKYATKTGYNITDEFILNHVCPHIASLVPRQISLVLGRALLWAIYDEEASQQTEDCI